MNRLLLFVAFAGAFFSSSCSDGYIITGSTDDAFLNGERIYIKTEADNGWLAVDSCDILHGKFRMSGSVNDAFVAALFVGNESVVPLVVEEGRIFVSMERLAVAVKGTRLNNELSGFILRKESFENRLTELERMETAMILDGYTAEAAAAFVKDSIKAVGAMLDVYIEDFIRQHYSTVLGPCVFRLLCSTLPYPYMTRQIERIVADAPDIFKDDAFVKEFVSIATENKRRLTTD